MSAWPRHVLLTADTIGGVWTFALELARGLIEQGIDVTIATAGGLLTPAQWKQVRAMGDPAIVESEFKLEWQDDPWSDVDRAGDWLQGLVDRVQPDVLHLNDYSQAARRWGIPVVVTGHSCVLSWFQAVRNARPPETWNEYRWRVERGLHCADLVTAPTSAMLESLAVHYGPLPHTKAIPNGRDPGDFASASKQPLIFAAGRLWDEAKNVSMLARVAEKLPWPVYVAGERQRAIFENVTPLGVLDREALAGWMSRAAIYCLPAKYEPFGLSILEAALSGCALILGDIGSLRENWTDCALFVDPQDPKALKNAALKLIDDDALRSGLARKALARARRFSARKMVQAYLRAYSMARAIAEEQTLDARVSA